MTNIKVKRDGIVGTVEPSNGKWKVVIAEDGMPELLIASKYKTASGEILDGYIDARYLPPEVPYSDYADSVFEGELSEEELAALDPKDYPTVNFGR